MIEKVRKVGILELWWCLVVVKGEIWRNWWRYRDFIVIQLKIVKDMERMKGDIEKICGVIWEYLNDTVEIWLGI